MMSNTAEGLSAPVPAPEELDLPGTVQHMLAQLSPLWKPTGILPRGAGLELFRSLLGGSQLSLWLWKELWCWTRHSGWHFRGQVPYTGHSNEAEMTCAKLPCATALQWSPSIYELLSTVGTVILNTDDMKLTHSSYLNSHSSPQQQ